MRLDHITPKGLLSSIPIYSHTLLLEQFQRTLSVIRHPGADFCRDIQIYQKAKSCVCHQASVYRLLNTGSPGDNSKWVPPDPLSNSEVKPLSADDSVGSPHVKVGHRRGITKSERPPCFLGWPFCFWGSGNDLIAHGSHMTKLSGTILNCAGLAQARRVEGRMPGNKVGHRRGIKRKARNVNVAGFFCLIPRDAYLNMVHVTKLSGTILHCAGFARPKGGRQDAWNRVGHRRGITKSERPPVFWGGLFAFWDSENDLIAHGKPCDKIVWNNFALRGVCAARRV